MLFITRQGFSFPLSFGICYPEVIKCKDFQSAMNPNKAQHIFGRAVHNLGTLTTKLGEERNVIQTILNALNEGGHLAASTVIRLVYL